MASISTDKKTGTRRVQFVNASGQRKTIHCGKTPQRNVETVVRHVEYILAAQATNDPLPKTTAEWIGGLDANWREKLSRVGLVAEQVVASDAEAWTVAKWVDAYIANRVDVKPSTANNYGHARRCLIEYFGETKLLPEVTADDAAQYRRWLGSHKFGERRGAKSDRLSENTTRRRVARARQFFAAAFDARHIVENPFRKLKDLQVRGNRARDYFLSREDATKILAACPDAQWQLIFALSRYAGFRCPCEHLALRRDGLDLANGRMRINSPKTGPRTVPIFSEIRPHLTAVLAEAREQGDESEYVITRYRGSKQNLRTTFAKIIKRAGLTPWPKLFHNLRATRQTELCGSGFPSHVVCEWIGNSEAVAKEHYLRATDADFAAAAGLKPAERTGEKTAQKTAQHQSARGGTRRHEPRNSRENPKPPRQSKPKAPPVGLEGPRRVGEILASRW